MAFADHPTLHPLNLRRSIEAHVPRKAMRDWWNRVLYGPDAPRSDECIYVRPRDVNFHYTRGKEGRSLRRQQSGRIVDGDWDLQRQRVESYIKYDSCRMHFIDGVPWEQTPQVQEMIRQVAEGRTPDACTSREDVMARYAGLDRVFDEVQRLGRLLTRAEMPEYFRREHGGILIHVGRDGTLLRASGGIHRFAIAKILDLPEIPAQLGVVHPQAIYMNLLAPLRKSIHDS
ncbi:hypothetical protein P775_17915 [Puniceibacterium antarcticum]|uniref:ParB/Sulfiredoxin domain-containing protein n=1 Tax=Puniceibacterium antarcticum TaxID=1206336 RepID=A0A2G8RAH7_9RHOB|nr:hypothetical protein [Puniceibacterium antarcticum]PIL18451.1 hypothetical protein P775_17915 [Puniceibacterium antarcticum]